MKTLMLATAAAFLPFTLSAADKASPGAANLRELLQQGLFEEEANQDAAKAAAAYADLVAQYDTQRAFAATALYRLAEIRAKEGKKDEAIALHQRLLTEFPNHEAFAKRSRERLAELGGALPPAAAVAQADAPTEAEAKELVQLREMVKNSPDLLNAWGETDKITPLEKASKNGWLAAASFLLDHGADPNRDSGNPLRLAAEQGHKRMVELLLKRGASANLDYALFRAVANNRLEVARVLLANGADPNFARRGPAGTPLQTAISRGNNQLMRLLLENKADPSFLDGSGNSPLSEAVGRKNETAVKELLDRGANVNAVLPGGETVLHQAASNWPAVVPLLLEHDSSVQAGIVIPGGTQGQTPLHFSMYAFSRGKDSDLEQLYKFWEAFLAKGADINAKSAQGQTPLHLAATRPDLPVNALAWLVDHGADLNAEDKDGLTVFDYAHRAGIDRRIELEQRFRLSESPEKLAIKWLLPKRYSFGGNEGKFERGFASISATSETVAPPAFREILSKAFEGMSGGPWPGNFSVRVYRTGDNGKLAELAQVPLNAESTFPASTELPELKWGDVLVLDPIADFPGIRTHFSKADIMKWLGAASSSAQN